MKQSTLKGFLYVIHAEGTSRVKIGFSDDPLRRLSELQTGSPFPLVIVGVTEGTLSIERSIHAQLEYCRVAREWFDIVPQEAFRIVSDVCAQSDSVLGKVKPKPRYLTRKPTNAERRQFQKLLPQLECGRWVVETEGKGWKVRWMRDKGKTTRSVRLFRLRWPTWNLIRERYDDQMITRILEEKVASIVI